MVDEIDRALQSDDPAFVRQFRAVQRAVTATAIAVVTLSLVLALAAGPLYNFALRAAGDLVDRGLYIEAATDP